MAVVSERAFIDFAPVTSRADQTVLRSLVHKQSLDNVLLTALSIATGDRFICAGRLTSNHSFFNDAGRKPRKDILFYTELGRQASLAVSHAFLDVSTDDVFIFEGSDATLTDAAYRTARPSDSDLVIIDIKIQEITRRKNNAVSRVVAKHRMSIGSEVVFHGTGAWTVQPAALFHRLRRQSLKGESPIVAGPAHRRFAPNVVVTRPTRIDFDASFGSTLIVDNEHPYFFDHPCDHVPGMLLLEGCAQLAVAAFAQTTCVASERCAIYAYEVNFSQFVECGLPTTLSAHVNAEDDVEVVISQPDVICGTTKMRVAFPV